MNDAQAQRAAFAEIVAALQSGAMDTARALQVPGEAARDAILEAHFDHTLDRLAALYGRGTYENLGTVAIFDTAIANEAMFADDCVRSGLGDATAHLDRAQALVGVARRGVRIDIGGAMPSVRPRRGAFLRPLRPEVAASLRRRREPFELWRDGAIVTLRDGELDKLRDDGDDVALLFLDADELLDLAAGDRAFFEQEVGRRLAIAEASPARLGDSWQRHRGRRLLEQSTVLGNLRDRLTEGHPMADRAFAPLLAGWRAFMRATLGREPEIDVSADPLRSSIRHERRLQELLAVWTTKPDAAGLKPRIDAVAQAGSSLTKIEALEP